MSPIERDILRRKLETIVANLRLLRALDGVDADSYSADPWRRKATERMLQEIVDAAVDVNAHVAVGSGRPAPDDLYSSFGAAADAGLISHELARVLAPSAGLRNRLVHEYDALDDRMVLQAVADAQVQYARFVAAVERFLQGDE